MVLSILDENDPRDEWYTIVSVGSGLCFEEALVLAKAATRFSHIRLILIDPLYKNTETPTTALNKMVRRALEDLQRLKAQLKKENPTATIEIDTYADRENYRKFATNNGRDFLPDLLLLIDLQDLQSPNYAYLTLTQDHEAFFQDFHLHKSSAAVFYTSEAKEFGSPTNKKTYYATAYRVNGTLPVTRESWTVA